MNGSDAADEQAIVDAKAFTATSNTDGWQVYMNRLKERRDAYGDQLLAFGLESSERDVLLLRMRRNVLAEVLAIGDEIIGDGVAALDAKKRQDQEAAAEAQAKEAQEQDQKKFAFSIRELLGMK